MLLASYHVLRCSHGQFSHLFRCVPDWMGGLGAARTWPDCKRGRNRRIRVMDCCACSLTVLYAVLYNPLKQAVNCRCSNIGPTTLRRPDRDGGRVSPCTGLSHVTPMQSIGQICSDSESINFSTSNHPLPPQKDPTTCHCSLCCRSSTYDCRPPLCATIPDQARNGDLRLLTREYVDDFFALIRSSDADIAITLCIVGGHRFEVRHNLFHTTRLFVHILSSS